MTLDPRCEAWLDRCLAQATPLTERQQDAIAAAFNGAIKLNGAIKNSTSRPPSLTVVDVDDARRQRDHDDAQTNRPPATLRQGDPDER